VSRNCVFRHGGAVAHRSLLTASCLLLTACGGISPLRKHAIVGRDSYAVFVADGADGAGELFAVRGDGGPVFPITFTPVREAKPALSPDGFMLAFLRTRRVQDTVPSSVWVMNLLTGAERRIELPAESEGEAVGWSRDGRSLVVSAGRFAWEVPAPPELSEPRAIPPSRWHRVDSALGVFVGDPPFARVYQCEESLCAAPARGSPASLAENARDPARWGPDSLAYFSAGELLVRPAGPGKARAVPWTAVPPNPRQLSAFPGAPSLNRP
jgi:dipeptidyl aminopeptidase/acylaminoacyl peptidase